MGKHFKKLLWLKTSLGSSMKHFAISAVPVATQCSVVHLSQFSGKQRRSFKPQRNECQISLFICLSIYLFIYLTRDSADLISVQWDFKLAATSCVLPGILKISVLKLLKYSLFSLYVIPSFKNLFLQLVPVELKLSLRLKWVKLLTTLKKSTIDTWCTGEKSV